MGPVAHAPADRVSLPETAGGVNRLEPAQLVAEGLTEGGDQFLAAVAIHIIGGDNLGDAGNLVPPPVGLVIPPSPADDLFDAVAVNIDRQQVGALAGPVAVDEAVGPLAQGRWFGPPLEDVDAGLDPFLADDLVLAVVVDITHPGFVRAHAPVENMTLPRPAVIAGQVLGQR
jgi:hypothetical protein